MVVDEHLCTWSMAEMFVSHHSIGVMHGLILDPIQAGRSCVGHDIVQRKTIYSIARTFHLSIDLPSLHTRQKNDTFVGATQNKTDQLHLDVCWWSSKLTNFQQIGHTGIPQEIPKTTWVSWGKPIPKLDKIGVYGGAWYGHSTCSNWGWWITLRWGCFMALGLPPVPRKCQERSGGNTLWPGVSCCFSSPQRNARKRIWPYRRMWRQRSKFSSMWFRQGY